MKYRKKPVVIEAVKFMVGTSIYEKCPLWLNEAFNSGVVFKYGRNLFIKTLEGHMKVSEGDCIIQGVQGEIYPCKPDVFEQTYEQV